MKILKNRFAVGIMCIVLSLAIGLIGIPLLADRSNAKIEVVRLETDVKKGTRLTSEMLEIVTVGKENLPEGIAVKKDEAVNLYSLTDMVKGEFIFSKKVANSPAKENEYLYTIPQGKMALSVTIRSLAAGLSGKLMPKDIVTIFSVEEENKIQGQLQMAGQNLTTKSYPELQYVEVLSVTASSGRDTDKTTRKEDGKTESETANDQASTVTLLVNRQQSERLTVLERKGGIHIGLVFRGDNVLAQDLLTKQEKAFVPTDVQIQGDKKSTSDVSGMGAINKVDSYKMGVPQ